jgi:hypothetical protein
MTKEKESYNMINTMKLRKILGWLGMLLPWLVAALYMIFEVHAIQLPHSISATYYVSSCVTPFMIILGAAGILLVCYDGYDKQDAIICTLAGIFGLCICVFPCSNDIDPHQLVGTFQLPAVISGWIHNITAVIFFGLLAYNSFFLFTKSSGNMTAEKRKRNIIFKVCGIGMISSFVLLIPLLLLKVSFAIWLVEAIALMFFGISWLTKAQCYKWLFKDKI